MPPLCLATHLFVNIRHPKKRRYLFALAESGSRTRAAEAAEVHPTILYTPQWKGDGDFQECLQGVREVAADMLEDEARRRAVEGVLKPTGWYKGKRGGFVREYSDILLIVLLKALRPDQYKDRVELKGTLANIDMKQLPDDAVRRIAAGEHPMAVLGSLAALKALPPARDATDSDGEAK